MQTSRFRIPMMLGFFGLMSLWAVGGARAISLNDIPIQLGSALGITTGNAGLLLSCGILVSIGMLCALMGRKMNVLATAIPMMASLGFLVAIGWLPYWILLVIAVIVSISFAGPFRTILTGK